MTNVQIRNVSPETHRRLVELADREGMSLSEYLRVELERIAALPTWDEIGARLDRINKEYGPVNIKPGEIARLIREDRESH